MRLRLFLSMLMLTSMSMARGDELSVDVAGDVLPGDAITRFGSLRYRTLAGSRQLAFSPDGKRLAAAMDGFAGSQRWFHVYDVATGKVLQTFREHETSIWAVQYSSDGKMLLSTSNCDVCLWDAESGRELRRVETSEREGGVISAALSADGTRLAAATPHAVYLWSLPDEKRLLLFPAEEAVHRHVEFSADSKLLAAGPIDYRNIKLWDAETGVLRLSLDDRQGGLESFAFSPVGGVIASILNGNHSISLWDARLRGEVPLDRKLREMTGPATHQNAIAFSRDGKLVAAAGNDRLIWFWDSVTGNEVRKLSGHTGTIESLTFSPDGKLLASGADDSTIRLWDLEKWHEVTQQNGHGHAVRAVAFAPDRDVLASGSEDGTVRLWDLSTRRQIASFEGSKHGVRSIAFSQDGAQLASSGDKSFKSLGFTDKLIQLWNLRTGKLEFEIDGHKETSIVSRVAFSPDGKVIASGSDDQTVRLWDAAKGWELSIIGPFDGKVDAMEFVPDGKALLVGLRSDRDPLVVCELASQKLSRPFDGHRRGVICAAIFPGGDKMVSASSDGTARVWGIDSGEELLQLGQPLLHVLQREGERAVTREMTPERFYDDLVLSIAVSPDSNLIATGSNGGTIRLWEASSGRQLANRKGHEGPVYALAFSTQGDLLASGSADTTILLWSVASLLAQEHEPR